MARGRRHDRTRDVVHEGRKAHGEGEEGIESRWPGVSRRPSHCPRVGVHGGKQRGGSGSARRGIRPAPTTDDLPEPLAPITATNGLNDAAREQVGLPVLGRRMERQPA